MMMMMNFIRSRRSPRSVKDAELGHLTLLVSNDSQRKFSGYLAEEKRNIKIYSFSAFITAMLLVGIIHDMNNIHQRT